MRSPPAIANAFPQPGKSHIYGSVIPQVSTQCPKKCCRSTPTLICMPPHMLLQRCLLRKPLVAKLALKRSMSRMTLMASISTLHSLTRRRLGNKRVTVTVITYLQMPQNLLFTREALLSIPITPFPKAIVCLLPTSHMLNRDVSGNTITGAKVEARLGASSPMTAKFPRVRYTRAIIIRVDSVSGRFVGAGRCAGYVGLRRRAFVKTCFGGSLWLQFTVRL
jgi:hypothetical protein